MSSAAFAIAATQRGFWASLLILALVIIGLFTLGIFSALTSLWTAVGVGIIALGIYQLAFGAPPRGIALLVVGVIFVFGGVIFPPLTIGDALTLAPGGTP